MDSALVSVLVQTVIDSRDNGAPWRYECAAGLTPNCCGHQRQCRDTGQQQNHR
jgi:hypothetical protein